MRSILLLIHRAAEHPYVATAISLLLFAGAFTETMSTFHQDLESNQLRAHHGLMLFAGVQLLSALADTLESFLEMTETEEGEAEDE